MDFKDMLCADTWMKPTSSENELPKTISSSFTPSTNFNLQQHQQKMEDRSFLNYNTTMEPPVPHLSQPSETRCPLPCNRNDQMKPPDQEAALLTSATQAWDPRAMLNNLSFLEQKIHQLQDLVHLIKGRKAQVLGRPDELVAQQQQLINADLTSIIVQLISTAGNLLPSVKQSLSSVNSVGQVNETLFPPGAGFGGDVLQNNDISCNTERNCNMEEHEPKDEEDVDEGENLPPGSYEILQLEKEEILAPHTHFCLICGKGFKRDANLRMHMRGHGDEYKTPAALAKPSKEYSAEPMIVKRYSCPYAGCKRNKEHKKFQPLKTILCVKNHYKRTHCDKSYICSRCKTKKFSVMADLKTHEKHCGKDNWLCSCGTTFSRKDKLFGHIALFQGHTPAIPHDESKVSAGSSSDRGDGNQASNKFGSVSFNFGSSSGNGVEDIIDMKGGTDDPTCCFSPFNFDTCNFDGFHEFPRPPFDDSESSFSFLMPVSCNYSHKTGGESNSGNLESC